MLKVYAAFYAALFSPVLFGGRLLAPRDGLSFYYVHYRMPATAWEPRLGTGTPILADPQAMTWYPPAILMSWWPGSWNVFVVSAYVLASWFTFLFVRELTGRRLPAFLAGLGFGTTGFMVSHLPHASVIHAALWLPAALFIVERLRAGATARRTAALSAVIFCSVTAGHLQVAFYALCIVSLYALAVAWRDGARRWSILGATAAGIGLGLLASAVQLVPTAELAAQSIRGRLTYEDFVAYSLAPHQLVTLVFPYVLGGVGGRLYPNPYFGPADVSETTGFLGCAMLSLAGVAVVAGPRRTEVRFWAVAGIVSALLALGSATPVSGLLFELPLVGSLRAQGRFLLVVDFAVVVLAGIGLDAALRERAAGWRFKVIPVAALTALGAAVVGFRVWQPVLQRHAADGGIRDLGFTPLANPAILIPLVMGVLVAAALWWVLHRADSAAARLALSAAVIAELLSFAAFHEWRYRSPRAAEADAPAGVSDIRERLQDENGRWLAAAGVFTPPELLPPERSALWDVPSASRFNSLLPQRLGDLLGLQPYGGVEGAWGAFENRALDIASVRLVGVPAAYGSHVVDGRRWRLVRHTSGGGVFENLRALPRVRLAREARTMTPAEILESVRTSRLPDGSAFDPATTALVEEPIGFDRLPPVSTWSARTLRSDNEIVEVETDTHAGAILILADLYYPGWTATIDRRLSKIFRVNYVQRGVVVPPGRHVVRFVFSSTTARAGGAMSLAAAVVLIAMVFRRREGAERRQSA